MQRLKKRGKGAPQAGRSVINQKRKSKLKKGMKELVTKEEAEFMISGFDFSDFTQEETETLEREIRGNIGKSRADFETNVIRAVRELPSSVEDEPNWNESVDTLHQTSPIFRSIKEKHLPYLPEPFSKELEVLEDMMGEALSEQALSKDILGKVDFAFGILIKFAFICDGWKHIYE